MKRFAMDKLLAWKNSPHRKPLLLLGARQVGKTTLIEHLFGDSFNKVTMDDLEVRNFAKKNPKEFLEYYHRRFKKNDLYAQASESDWKQAEYDFKSYLPVKLDAQTIQELQKTTDCDQNGLIINGQIDLVYKNSPQIQEKTGSRNL